MDNFHGNLSEEVNQALLYVKIFDDVGHFSDNDHNLIDNLKDFYKFLNNYENVLFYLQKSLAVRLKIYGEIHPDVADNYIDLGNAYYNLGKIEKASDCCQLASNIFLTICADMRPNIAKRYKNLGNLYMILGDIEPAREYLVKALSIYKKFNLQEDIDDVQNSLQIIQKAERDVDLILTVGGATIGITTFVVIAKKFLSQKSVAKRKLAAANFFSNRSQQTRQIMTRVKSFATRRPGMMTVGAAARVATVAGLFVQNRRKNTALATTAEKRNEIKQSKK
jgi:tetratricopeptide (TPR) repeat protein